MTAKKGLREIGANPAAPDAEMAALGSAMIERWASMKMLQMLRREDFYDDRNRLVYDAIAAVADRAPESVCDMVTVKEELRRKTWFKSVGDGKGDIKDKATTALDEVGGGAYIAQCFDAVSNAENVELYCKYVKESSLEREIHRQITTTAGDPTSENVKKVGDLILALQGTRGGSIFDMREDLGPMVEKILQEPERGTPTGFQTFDFLTNGGPVAEELITIGARPGAGKTATMLKMACNMAEALALAGNPNKECVLYLTTEMTVKSLVQRILPMVTGIPHRKFRSGGLDKAEIGRVMDVCGDGLDTFPLKMMGRSRLSIDDIRGAIFQAKPKVVFIDYLQRCRLPKADNMAYALQEFMADLKSLMVDCRIAGFIGCQADRELDKFPDQPPMMAHLKGSGGIESESDMVVMLWEPTQSVIAKRFDWVPPRDGCKAIEGIIRKARSGADNVAFDIQLEGELIKMTDRLPYSTEPRQGDLTL